VTHTILLVEDNEHIMKINRDTLADAGYRVLEAGTLAEARAHLNTVTPDSFVVDIMLPDGDGRDFCRELRARYGIDAPVLFLTALKGKPDMEKGYGAGGTDYLTKPFDLDHLVMKVTALLAQQARTKRAETEYRAGGLRVDFVSRRVYMDGEDLLLKIKEYALLELLVKNRGGYIAAEELYRQVWNMEPEDDVRTVKEHMYWLRRKLGDHAPVSIDNERGAGYRLTEKR